MKICEEKEVLNNFLLITLNIKNIPKQEVKEETNPGTMG